MKRLVLVLGVASVLAALSPSFVHADLQRFVEVAPGILRGDQPDDSEDYKTLKLAGVRTLLNLRNDETVDWERAVAARMGFDFENVPLSPITYPREEDISQALMILTDPAKQPVYVHCQHGRDRTGLIVGLYRVHFEQWPRDFAFGEMKNMGFNPLLLGLTSYFFAHTPDSSE